MTIALIIVSIILILVLVIAVLIIKELLLNNDELTRRHHNVITDPQQHIEEITLLRNKYDELRRTFESYNRYFNSNIHPKDPNKLLCKIFWNVINGNPNGDIEAVLKEWKKTRIVNKPQTEREGKCNARIAR